MVGVNETINLVQVKDEEGANMWQKVRNIGKNPHIKTAVTLYGVNAVYNGNQIFLVLGIVWLIANYIGEISS